ncbi:hypothetical protein [Actinoplanes sp. NPDC089786]|uniref:hypothetical protein n=1 Tax=Actinoplanes sp. NPDC089786 TaxID=3155185 RepID=UPI0034328F4F
MNSIPVDLTRLVGVLCVSAPERRTDLDGAIRKDREGNELWVTGIAVRRAGTRKASVIDVQTAVQPQGVAEGTPVGFTELDAQLWEIEGRHGLSYRAASVYPAKLATGATEGSPSPTPRPGKASTS